jgi:NAD-dependent dihydropyrimidine dehydrogenase PreA subunit/predicted transcriptional regulator
MAPQNEDYQKIADMWSFGKSESFRKMLEALMTPEDAALLLQCTTAVTVPELAAKLKVDEKSLGEKLESLFKRGLIFKGQTQYQFRKGIHFGFAGQVTPVNAEAYKQWRQKWEEENPKREVYDWLERFKKSGNQVHRIYPSRLAVRSNPAIKKEDLLWHEDIDQVFERAEIIIAGPCGCRAGGGMGVPRKVDLNLKSTRCNHPMWNCFQFSKKTLEDTRKRGGDMVVYSVDEAIAKVNEAELAGLCHEGPGNAAVMPGVLCCCASDCCSALISCQASGEDLHALYTASRFLATIDQDKCNGCQTCVERCSFNCIEMVKAPGSKKMKAQITAKDCYGCGVCVIGCPQKAIKFDLIRPPEHIPAASASGRVVVQLK